MINDKPFISLSLFLLFSFPPLLSPSPSIKAMLNLGDDFVANALSFEHALAETTMKNDQSREYPSYYTNTTLDALCTAKGLAALRSLDAKELNYAEADRNFALDDAQAAAASAFLEQMCELFDFRAVL